MGDGGFGLLHAALLVKRGVRAVLAGRHEDRLKLARSFGVEHMVNVRESELAPLIASLTAGRGADALIESTGQQAVWEAAPSFVRRGGTVSFFGGLPSGAKVAFSAARMHYDEVRLISPFHFGPRAVRRAYELLAEKQIDPRPLVTQAVPLTEIAGVFERLDRGEGIKFAVQP
jgi:L-iditol 2-dehydrogenase